MPLIRFDVLTILCILLVLPVAYAEIHYTLKGFSLVFRRRPEILADAPWRLEPGQILPLMILVKDAHRFPVKIEQVSVRIVYEDGSVENQFLDGLPKTIETQWWHRLWEIEPKKKGHIQLSAQFNALYLKTGKSHTFQTDNLWSSTHRPLDIMIAPDPLPAFENWHSGDLHFHSANTNDQVEYGAPLNPAVRMAGALGLKFMAVTDHSYDLDDRMDNYLEHDPELPKWHAMHLETEKIEKETGLVVVPGEEVSCGNHRNENTHLLLLNNRHYFPGAGDSNERWFQNQPDMRVHDILNQIDEYTLAFAAHPGVTFAPLQRILLRRGIWHCRDFRHPRLHGLQIYNGGGSRHFKRGRKMWIRELLRGRRPVVIAGNDAHGNFNRHRKLGRPFLYIAESKEHTFGRGRTLLRLTNGPNRKNIMDAIRQGRAVISTGPVMDMRIMNKSGDSAGIGDTITGQKFTLQIRGKSSAEFGHIKYCRIYLGDLLLKKERLFKQFESSVPAYDFSDQIEFNNEAPAYIRAELDTQSGINQYFCLTNPVFLNTELHSTK
ncbi:PHP domain-containing protein [bacterium]|nr:PHP domain-containing protein [bacterium]